MKILVFSDSHDVLADMYQAAETEKPELILHLGDHDYDCEDIVLMYPDITVRTVKGNCDRFSQGLDVDEFVIEGKRFLMTHGHLLGVKMGLGRLREFASSRNANVMLFGHTHRPVCETWIDGITYINPGSIGSGSKTYAVIELNGSGLTCGIKAVRQK